MLNWLGILNMIALEGGKHICKYALFIIFMHACTHIEVRWLFTILFS